MNFLFFFLITKNNIDDAIIGQIKISLNLRNVSEDLDLSHSEIDDSFATGIADKLRASNTIKSVNLSCKPFIQWISNNKLASQIIKSVLPARMPFLKLFHQALPSKKLTLNA